MADGPSVNDIPDNELVGRVVRNIKPSRGRRQERWVAVMDAFALGSTYAQQLCLKYGKDPDEMVKR